jgi:drug/metabolite transporter (DMT)-like permease
MKPCDLADLLLLAALWGASFLFMRIAAPDFGAAPLAALRVAGAAMLLLPMLTLRGAWPALRRHWWPIAVVGLCNSALPFTLFAHAALSIEAGVSAILNATSPLFGVLFAALWLREPSNGWRLAGLPVALIGVALLVGGRIGLKAGAAAADAAVAIALCLSAAVLYGFSANYARRSLSGVPPLAIAAGSQAAAALLLAPAAALTWPAATAPWTAWVAVLALALPCTGVAYVLYFRLIANVGAARAITVTFLVPAFAVLWGAMFLGEAVDAGMLVGGVVILAGTALATGLLYPPAWHRSRG